MSEMTPPNAIDMQHTINRLTVQLADERVLHQLCSLTNKSQNDALVLGIAHRDKHFDDLAASRAECERLRELLLGTPEIFRELAEMFQEVGKSDASATAKFKAGMIEAALAASGKETTND